VSARAKRLSACLVAFAVVAAALVVVVQLWPSPAPIQAQCQASGQTGTYTLDLDQAANATTIAGVARRMRLPDHAVTVAIEAALQESGLHDLDHGDRDSVGLFQQRPSQGWGTRAQILDTRYAAMRFFRRLAAVQNWATRAVADAAQSVQRSAAPDAYVKWEGMARSVAAALTGETPAGLGCQFPAPRHVGPPAVHAAILTEWGGDPLDRPVATKRGWMIASWLVGNAQRLGIRAVTVAGQRWQSTSQRWTPDTTTGSEVRIQTS
jgi:hypothetical protein